MNRRFIITGNGIAGVTAAATLSSEDRDAEITIFGEEKYPYYRRPWLPDFLAGNYEREELHPYAPSWYEKRHIKVETGARVVSVHREEHTVELESGRQVPYDKLLLACGGSAWIPPVSNSNLQGVFTLRTLDDAYAIREYGQQVKTAIVVGGGLLGLEAARGLRGTGLEVTVVEIFPYLLPRQLDAEGAAILTYLIERMGITVVTGAIADAVMGQERVEGLQLKSGMFLPAEMVLFSSGIRSNLTLAKSCGLATNRGVIANEYMQSSDPDIFLAGDAAEFQERVYGIIPAAIEQARSAAANMVAANSATYGGTTAMNTLKVLGIDLTAIGNVNPEGEGFTVHRKAHLGSGLYKKVVFEDDTLVGAVLLGERKSVIPMTRLVNQRAKVGSLGPQILEEEFDLKALL